MIRVVHLRAAYTLRAGIPSGTPALSHGWQDDGPQPLLLLLRFDLGEVGGFFCLLLFFEELSLPVRHFLRSSGHSLDIRVVASRAWPGVRFALADLGSTDYLHLLSFHSSAFALTLCLRRSSSICQE